MLGRQERDLRLRPADEVDAAKELVDRHHLVARIEQLGGPALADDLRHHELQRPVGCVAVAQPAQRVGRGARTDVGHARGVAPDVDHAVALQRPAPALAKRHVRLLPRCCTVSAVCGHR
jgi:hypothetical protein